MELPKFSADQKKLLYSIGEVAYYLEENVSAIRYWTNNFSALKPTKNKKGNRFYSRKDFELLVQLHYLIRHRKMTFPGAKEYLRNHRAEVEYKAELVLRLSKVKQKLEGLLEHFDEIESDHKKREDEA